MTEKKWDLCVAGGGSAGIGAALAAARRGLRVILVERNASLGGNAVHGGVHNWEPGVGGTAFPKEIYQGMRRIPDGAGVWSFGRHWCWPESNVPPFPGGETVIDPLCSYDDTLKRHGTAGLVADEQTVRQQWHGIVFEPSAYVRVVNQMLAGTGNCDVLLKAGIVDCTVRGSTITEVTVRSEEHGEQKIRAACFIDGTSGVQLCQAAGCETVIGVESAEMFDEPSAPEKADPSAINAVTLVYRAAPSKTALIEELPGEVPADCWFGGQWPGASIGHYPCGDLNINMLPTMEGAEFLAFVRGATDGYRRAYQECRRRVLGHWHFLQVEYPEFRHYRLKWVAPSLGVREGRRVRGSYVLTEADVRGGLSSQRHSDLIAIADHALDIHGKENKGCAELAEPYGVPYRCLTLPTISNLLVAGMGASFSHIAASSCRLSRTMMDLGHAAGNAAALAVAHNSDVHGINPDTLKQTLAADGAALHWDDWKNFISKS